MKFNRSILCMSLLSTMVLFNTNILAQGIKVYINDKEIEMEVKPEINRDMTFVPISVIAKELGAQVRWESPQVIIKKGDTELICTIGSNEVQKNGEKAYLAAAPYISDNRTFVPLRFISEQLGNKVSFDNGDKIINIGAYGLNEEAPDISDVNNVINQGFEDSPNGLWGIKKEQTYSEVERQDVVYIKDNISGEIKELYTTTAFLRMCWLQDSKLLLSGITDVLGGPDRKHIMCYDPNTGNFSNLVDADGFEYLKSMDSIIYFKRLPGDDNELVGSDCKLLNLTTGVTLDITSEQYSSYIFEEFNN